MCSVSRGGDSPIYLWINPKFAIPDMVGENEEAEEILRTSKLFYAFNAPFEQAMTWGAKQRRAPCPFLIEPPLENWRDTAAVARKAGLPWNLEQLGEVLNLPTQKDRKGEALKKFFTVPNKEGKFNEPRDYPEKWLEFCAYCVTDNRVEKLAEQKLHAFELQGASLEAFQFDLRMNQRGIPINLQAAKNAQVIIDKVQGQIATEFRRITGLNPTQRAKVQELVGLPNMQAETVEEALKDPLLTANVHQLLEMYQKVSYSAVKKVRIMLDCICPDNFVRGGFIYYGAGTGRWSGRLLQPHNFKRTPRWMKKMTGPVYLQICKSSCAESLSEVYGEPIELISGCIRHFIHDPSRPILDGDYTAVEGVIGCWRAGQLDILEDWRTGKDLYRRAAAFVYNIKESDIEKSSPKRDFGKVVELAGQFGLGTEGFMRTCDNWGVPCDEPLAERAIHVYYRPTHRKIVSRWYTLDDQAREAIANPGHEFGPFICRRIAGIMYLLMKLPSGRSLAYPRPEIKKRLPTAKELKKMKEGKKFPEKRFWEISYWGNIKGKIWGRIHIHGSKFFENEVQAIAADFMAHGSIVAEKRGMPPFMLVHDQGLAFALGNQTPEQFAAALSDLPTWAKGMPLKVDAKLTPWYTK